MELKKQRGSGSKNTHVESWLKLCCEGGSDNSYIKSHLILEHGPTEGPNSCKDKVELIEILMAVWRSVFWDEKTLQEVTQHLDHALLRYRNDLLKSGNKKDESSVTVKYRHDLKRVLLSYRELQQDPKRLKRVLIQHTSRMQNCHNNDVQFTHFTHKTRMMILF